MLSPATARALGYAVVRGGRAAVKVSGRKGLGVKADDLLDALVAKARAEVDARDPERDAGGRASATAQAIATGALRYFMLKFGAHPDHHLRHGGGARLHRRDRAPTSRTRSCAPATSSAKLEAEGHDVAALLAARARPSTLGASSPARRATRSGRCSLLMARTDEVAEQAIRAEDVALVAKHAFAVAQAFHSYYQKPRYSVLHAESEDLRACRDPRGRRASSGRWRSCGPARHPRAGRM